MSVFQVDGFAFFNNFECANLANVARGNPSGTSADGGGKAVNFAFNVWTSPDAAGTAFENKNRSWFCFGVTGGPGNCWIELTVMNMNRQKRLFNQGMMPAYMVLPSQPYWDRIPGKPVTYYYIGPDFVVTFQFKMPIDPGAEVYFAMTYPHNNAKIMAITDRLTSKFLCSSSIYFHREFLCYSAEGRRLDLLTISSFDGIGAEGEFEDPFDLTPLEEMADMKGNISQSMPRCFPGKKVIFISSRVHPGEVQATYVLNGFLKFLLSDSDPRAFLLRKAFVFKIIPNLNPDGVVRGHYRTDHRGVNLNRVYQAPCPLHHPTIFATRVLFMYHAAQSRKGAPDKEEECDDQGFTVPAETEDITTVESSQAVNRAFTGQVEEGIKSLSKVVKDEACQAVQERAASLDEETQTASVLMKTCEIQAEKSKDACSKYEDRESELEERKRSAGFDRISSGGNVVAACCLKKARTVDVPRHFNEDRVWPAPRTHFSEEEQASRVKVNVFKFGFGYRDLPPEEYCRCAVLDMGAMAGASGGPKAPDDDCEDRGGIGPSENTVADVPNYELSELEDCWMRRLKAEVQKRSGGGTSWIKTTEECGIFLYLDLHGHASKRGTFVYGNHMEDTDSATEALMFPKIMALNCSHFDFAGCDFRKGNTKVRGFSKEGAGRVQLSSMSRLIRCYTLECNYHSGRVMRALTPLAKELPTGVEKEKRENVSQNVKYSPQVLRDVGKAMGITILDMAGGNPHSRIGTSPYGSVAGVRHWLREHLSTGGAMPGAESVEGELEHICDAEDVCVAGKPESVERIRGAQKMIVLSEDDSDERVKKPEEPLESGVEKMPIESSEKDVGALLVEESKRDVMAAAVAESTVTVSGERSVAAKAAEEVAASLVSKADEAASLIAKEESSGKVDHGPKATLEEKESGNSENERSLENFQETDSSELLCSNF